VPILALNAGSSSVKYALFEGESAEPSAAGTIDLERESIGYEDAGARAVEEARKSGGAALH
jgi:acetate kinase